MSTAARRLAKQMIGRVSPALLARIQRARARRRYLGEPVGGPKRLLLEPTTACNHRCIMCAAHSPRTPRPVAVRTMPFARIEHLIRDVAQMGGEEVWLAGRGEPLVHPQAVEIIRLSSSLGLRSQVTSNGGRLSEEMAEGLCEAGLSRLSVSIDSGNPATYAQVHQGPPEDRQRILALLRQVSRRKGPRPEVRVSMVLSKLNRAEISQFVSDAMGAGVSVATIAGLRGVPFEVSDLALTEEDWAAVRRDLTAVAEMARLAGLTIVTDYVPAEKTAPVARPPYADMACFVGHVFTAVDADGDVHGCCSCANYLGSLTDAGFAEVWHSRRYRRFRQACREMPITGLMPAQCNCRECGNIVDNVAVQQEVRLDFRGRTRGSEFASRLDLAEAVWRHFRDLLPAARPGVGFADVPADSSRQATAALLCLQGLGLVKGWGGPGGRQVFEPDRITLREEVLELVTRVLSRFGTPAERADEMLSQASPPLCPKETMLKQELEAWVSGVRRQLKAPGGRSSPSSA
jgi:MoaA/NifB/PqqE/SkfB family radical SAM enzyme